MTNVSLNCKKAGIMTRMEELIESIHLMYQKAFDAFIFHNKEALMAVQEKNHRVEHLAREITTQIIANSYEEQESDRLAMLELVKTLEQIKVGAVKISDSISGKIKDGVLFSDKAVAEIKDVFEVVFECLQNLNDLVLTGNKVIAKHLVNKTALYSEVINEYSVEHEERLIKGICLPKSSIIYLTMLDALKDVLRGLKGIGETFQN